MKLGSTQRLVLENVAARRAPYAGHKSYAEWTRRMDAANQLVKRGWLTRLPPGHPAIEGATSDAIAASMYKLTEAGRDALGGARSSKIHGARKKISGTNEGRRSSTHMPKSQRHMMDEASRKIAEVNETFLELLPTMRRKELEKLIEKRPALWGRFAGYLTSGHVFVDDPPAKPHHATKKKSPAQLDREIAEALGGRRGHATMKDLSAVEDALGYKPEPGVVDRAEVAYGGYSTNELRREIKSLEDQFEMAGGRGVGLADRLDAARIALALRGSKPRGTKAKPSHATMQKHHVYRVSKDRRLPSELRGRSVVYLGEKELPASGGVMARIALLRSDGSTGDEYLVREHHLSRT